MKMLTKITAPLAVLLTILFLGGCIRSLHPIYTSSDVVFRDDLVGVWEQASGETTWQFTRSEDDKRDAAYRLVLTDDKGRPGTFLAHLVKLDGELFLDLFPMAPKLANNNFYQFHFQRVHTFLHVKTENSTLEIAQMNPKWLEKHLTANPDAIEHTNVTPMGHPPTGKAPDQNPAERLLLTASTAELRQFLTKNLDTKDAFANPIELTRID